MDAAVALIAAHLGVVDEEAINNMSMVFFDDVLEALGRRVMYEAVVNYAGNAFCEKSWDMIQENNPFIIAEGKDGQHSRVGNKLAGFLNSMNIPEIRPAKSYSEKLKEQKEQKENGKEKADAGDAG